MEKLSLICKKYLFWAVVGLSIFIPLYPKFPALNVSGTYVAIRAEDFLIAIVAVWWFLSRLSTLKSLINKTTFQAFLLFWTVGALSLLSGILLTHSVSNIHLGILHYLRRVEMMLLFFVAWDSVTSLKQLEVWFRVMLVVTLVAVMYGFGQIWFSFPVISTTNREFSKGLILTLTPDARVNSTFAGHYDFAAYLAIVLTLFATMVLYYRKIIQRLIIGISSVLSLIVLSLTAARVSFVAAVLGIAGVFWLTGYKKLILLILGVVLLVFVVSPDLRHRTIATLTVNLLGGGGPKYTISGEQAKQLASESANQKFSKELLSSDSATLSAVPVDIAPGEPVNTTELGVYRSFGIRFNEEWPRAIRAFEKNPLLGTGYSSLTIATDNDFLRSLGETGLLGTLALGLVWIEVLKKLWRGIKISHKNFSHFFLIGVFCLSLGVLINGLFIDILESSKVAEILWITLGLGFAASTINHEKDNY